MCVRIELGGEVVVKITYRRGGQRRWQLWKSVGLQFPLGHQKFREWWWSGR